MSRWSERWMQNEDGSYVRNISATPVLEGDGGYEDMSKEELQAELEARGLAKTGNKPELIERLEEADASDES